MQSKSVFEDRFKRINGKGKSISDNELIVLLDKSRCLSHKLSQLSFKL